MLSTEEKVMKLLHDNTWSHALYLNEYKVDLHNYYENNEAGTIPKEWFSRYDNNERVLVNRLQTDDLDRDQFIEIINNKHLIDIHNKMEWFKYLEDCFLQDTDININNELKLLDEKNIPFIEFFVPFLLIAKKTLLENEILRKTPLVDLPTISLCLAEIIGEEISKVSLKTLIFELNKSRLNNELIGETPEERYDYFIKMRVTSNEDILTILSSYPVLGRLISQITKSLTNNIISTIENLINDVPEITREFGQTYDCISNITSLGDAHKGGKRVFKIEFNNNNTLIYKPRNLSIDVNFQKLITWFNKKGIQRPLKTIKSLNKGSYGWQEFVLFKECSNMLEVDDYYFRQGEYLAILYMLNATDFHYENIISHGSQPILVDLESIFHVVLDVPTKFKTSAYDFATNIIADSVIRTSLLPIVADEAIFDFDISGLGGGISEQVERYRVINNKTDEMKMVKEGIMIPEGENLPKYKNEVVVSSDYIDSIKTGFKDTYQLIMKYQKELQSEVGILSDFKRDFVRVIMRDTNVYGLLLEASYHPKYLQSGLDRSRLFEMLWRVLGPLPNRTFAVSSEINEILFGDVPYFNCRIDSNIILGHKNMEIKGLYNKSSYELVLKKVNSFNNEDLKNQLNFIETSLQTKYAISVHNLESKIDKRSLGFEETSIYSLDKSKFLNEAIRIGEQIYADAIWGDEENEKSVTWIALGMDFDEKLKYSVMESGIYNGLLGMALFFAYLGKVSKNDRFKEIAKCCINTAIREDNVSTAETISAFSGYGSFVYVLQHLSEIWNDDSLMDTASSYLTKIEQGIDQDVNYDFLNGAAGTLIVLLNFYEKSKNDHALYLAEKCGKHLLNNAVKLKNGVGWTPSKDQSGPFLGGLSHGSSGIALSLMYLSNVTSNKEYEKLAFEALNYENSLFSSNEQNWIDLRPSVEKDSINVAHWCTGAPGIGLGRLQLLNFCDDKFIQEDLKIAINKTLTDGITGLNFSLCHGDLGNLELPLLAAIKLKDITLYKDTMENAFNILSTVEKDNNNWRCGVPGGQQTPNFMVGLAGIGFQLLRLYDHDIPSILILDT